jgi:prophage regulatory protein
MNERPERILRLPEVERRTGRKRSAIYSDPNFPSPVPIGPRAVGWLESEIDSWLQRCITERTNPTKPRSLKVIRIWVTADPDRVDQAVHSLSVG